jgi:VanZ family protein
MAYLVARKQVIHWILPICLVLSAGIGASLCIEIVQYYIPGRTSSMMDLIANAAGTMIGITFFIVEKNSPRLDRQYGEGGSLEKGSGLPSGSTHRFEA